MTDLQNKYDILLEDIKLLLQYDDKYMKIDKTNIVKPNILNELEKKISDIKQKQTGITLQIKNNNDKKELLINDISSITTQNTNIEKEITELNNNTKIIKEEQQLKLDLINSKCKELEELCNLFSSYKNCGILCIQDINIEILKNINSMQFDNTIIKKIIIDINNIYIVLFREYNLCKIENDDLKFLNDLNKPINNTKLLNKFNIEEKYIKHFIDIIMSKMFGGSLNFINEEYELYQPNSYCEKYCDSGLCCFIEIMNKNIKRYSWILYTNIYNEFISNKNKIDEYKTELINLEYNTDVNYISEQEIKYKTEYENIKSLLNELDEMKTNILEQIRINKLSDNTIDTIEQHLRLNKIQLDLTEQITIYSKQIDKLTLLDKEYKLNNKTNIETKQNEINNLLKDLKIQCIYILFKYNYNIQFNDDHKPILEKVKKIFNISKKLSNYIDVDEYNNYIKNYNFSDDIEYLYHLRYYLLNHGNPCSGGGPIEEYDGISDIVYLSNKKHTNFTKLFNSFYENIFKVNKRVSSKELQKIFEIICEDEINNLDLDIFNIYNEKMSNTMIIINNIRKQYINIFEKCKTIYDTIYNTNIISDYILKKLEIKEEINKINNKISELNTNSSKNIDIIKEKNDEIQKLLSLNTNLSLEINKYNIEISNLENEFTTIEKIYNLKKLYTS